MKQRTRLITLEAAAAIVKPDGHGMAKPYDYLKWARRQGYTILGTDPPYVPEYEVIEGGRGHTPAPFNALITFDRAGEIAAEAAMPRYGAQFWEDLAAQELIGCTSGRFTYLREKAVRHHVRALGVGRRDAEAADAPV